MTVTLHHGDCKDIVPTLAPQSVDAIITDIPYGTTACKWDEIIPFPVLWQLVKHVLKPRGVFVTTASQPFTSRLINSNINWMKYELIWEKSKATGHAVCNSRPMKAHENIIVFSENGHTYNPQMTIGKPYKGRKGANHKESGEFSTGNFRNDNGGSRYPRTVLKIQNAYYTEGQLHPTQKPVALYEYLIKTYTNEGDTVLDFCMGSGTTLVACVNTGRNGIGVEKEQNYFDIASRRIAQAQAARQLELV